MFRAGVMLDLGEFILIIRRRRNMSLRQLADASGVSSSTIHRIENGGYTDTAISNLVAVCSALGFGLRVNVEASDEEE